MSAQPGGLLAELQQTVDRGAGGRRRPVVEPIEPVEPWMSERDEDALMDGRAAKEAAHEPDVDEWGRWA